MASWRDILAGAVSDYAGALRVTVKTNLGPAFTIYDGRAQGPGFASMVGLKASFTVHGPDGQPIATYGEPPPTEPLRVACVLALIALGAFVVLRGATR